MAPTTEQLTPTFKIDGSPLANQFIDALIEMRFEKAYQVPARCVLRFTDPEYKLAGESWIKLGSVIDINFDEKQLGNVEVTGVAVEQLPGELPELVVTAHDVSHRLARGSTVKTYVQMTYSDIVTAVLGRARVLAGKIDATSGVHDYTLQTETDIAFISELANRVGYDWWVDDAKKFNFTKPVAGTTEVQLGREELHSFSVKATGHRPDSYQVIGWDVVQQAAAKSDAQAVSAASIKPSSTLADLAKSTPFGTAPFVSANVAAGTVAEANAVSSSLQLKGASASVVAKGVSVGDARLRPGAKVKVAGFGPLDGTYHVTEVEHVYGRMGMTSRFVAGDRHPTSLVDVLSHNNGSGSMTQTVGHSGLAVGVVTSLNDPDSRNRVRVKFPGLSDTNESAWARVLSLGGGESRGMVFIPEVGDEVLVGFENNDVRQPVILGGLYNANAAVPSWDVENGKVTARKIQSRTGHYVELADGEGDAKQHIQLMLEGNTHRLRLGKDRFDIELPANKPMTIKIGNSKIDIAGNGDMTLEARNIALKAQLNVTIEANAIDVKGKSQTNVSANREVAISAAQVGIEAKAMATIKGNAGVQIN